jgi:hypothetical protein
VEGIGRIDRAFSRAVIRGRSARRARLPFRSVNRKEKPDFQPGMQRHHLLPCQLASQRCFGPMFDAIGRERLGFDDFRANGLLLPASGEWAFRLRLPLHRGPHRDYNAVVAERVGQIEGDWSRTRLAAPEIALDQALMRFGLLQRALRRRLLQPERMHMQLNRYDPLDFGLDFAELDAMAEALWAGTAPELPM